VPRGTKITLLRLCSVHIVSNMEIQDAVQQDEGLVLRVASVPIGCRRRPVARPTRTICD
jgi:hypothetical protein